MKNLSSPLLTCGKTLKTTIFLSIFSIISPFNGGAQAANSFDAVINEIAWMGTESSYNDEWIELYNNTNSPIDISGWRLAAQDGTPKIILSGIIPANSFYLLERTDDNALPDIPADQIYGGALGNNGENLEIYDNFGNLIDSVNCVSGWFAGDNETKQTMARKSGIERGSDPSNWITSQNPGGTPKAQNGQINQPRSLKPEAEEPQTTIGSETKIEDYPPGIFINEILPSPVGPDEEEEWIEIFNQNQEEINLFNWGIADNVGNIKTYTFPQGTRISPQGFLVFSRQTTKIVLNNDGDGLSLIQPDGKVIETINFPRAPRGQSYNRTVPDSGDSVWSWNTILTPGAKNEISAQISEIKKENDPIEEKEKSIPEDNLEKEVNSQKGIAAVKGQMPTKNSNFFLVLLIALLVATLSGVIIFFLKRRLKKFDLKTKIE